MSAEAITEAASEKTRRGRPPAFPDFMLDFQRTSYPEVRSRRGLNDLCYRALALNVILHAPDPTRFGWLCDMEAMRAKTPNAWKPSILTELGRMATAADIVECAEVLCERKPSTKQAVAWLRRVRAAEIGDAP